MKTFRCIVDVEVDGVDEMLPTDQENVVAHIVKQRVGLYATAPISVVVIGEVSAECPYQVLQQPLTREEIVARKNKCNEVNGIVAVPLEELLDLDFDEVLNMMSERLVGRPLREAVFFNPVGVGHAGILHIEVIADVTELLGKTGGKKKGATHEA